MSTVRLGWAAATLLAVFCGAAAADDADWQTVTLADGITMDVPAVVHDNYKPSAESAKDGGVMYFEVTMDEFGDLACLLSRNDYSATFMRSTAIERLASRDRDSMCSAGDKVTGFDVGESESLSISGYAAGRCAAGYTDASDKQPGQVAAVMTVAAPDGFYMLSCTVYADTQDQATAHWVSQWQDIVHHVQESVKFPAT
ncbi:MAG: hypothetical protein KGJ78_14180 [Alphaproteobacteria bacterium]|nr:hypothetical protein [Alphaproteobacteria bacterium]